MPRVRRAISRCLHDYLEMKKWLALKREKLEINKEVKLGYTPDRMQNLNEFTSQFSIFDGSSHYWTLLRKSLQGRPFALHEGYTGLGPLETTADDIVSVFLGGQLPFVLQPVGIGMYRI